jgi:hypothetical protein
MILLGYKTQVSAGIIDDNKNYFTLKNYAIPKSDSTVIYAVWRIIDDAISSGAPVYNKGDQTACYRIYDGAAYKVLYLYGSKYKDAKSLLEKALLKTSLNYSDAEKAWILRMAFDEILGVPTQTK